MNDRDEEQARKFAVEWSTRSPGSKIGNLGGCYLRALASAALGCIQLGTWADRGLEWLKRRYGTGADR